MQPMDKDEQKVYDETAAAVEKGDFSQAFGDAAVSMYRIQRDMAKKTDIAEIMKILQERLPPKP